MIDRDRKLIFIHIPRTGGTSIEHNLNIKYLEDNLYGIHDYNGKKKALQHLDCNEVISIIGIDDYNECYKFTVIRHPYRRMISEFYWRPKSQSRQLPNLKSGYNFYKFLRQVKRIVENDEYDLTIFHDHFKPQYKFITLDGKLMVDKLIDFNELTKGYGEIRERYGIEVDLDKRQGSEYLTNISSILTPSCKELIQTIYKKDFEIFKFHR